MESAESPSAHYRFTTPIDILTTLDTHEIEHLEVSDKRTIVIYARNILNLQVTDGQLVDAQTIIIELFDPSPAASTDQLGFIETFVEELATTADSAWEHR